MPNRRHPPKTDRGGQLNIRLEQELLDMIRDRTKAIGLNPSTWSRMVLIREAKKLPKEAAK